MIKICRKILLVTLFAALLCFAGSCSLTNREEFGKKNEEWKSKRIADYRYNFKWVAYGPADVAGKTVTVEVRDGKNFSLDCSECENKSPEFFRQFDTINKVFDKMERVINSNPYSFQIKYDEKFKFPVRMDVELKGPETTDDEWYFEISDFQPLK